MRVGYYSILLSFMVLFSCDKGHVMKDYSVSEEAQRTLFGKLLFSKDNHSYFYDLKVSDRYCCFLDDLNDTTLWVYTNDILPELVACKKRDIPYVEKIKPSFTKEVYSLKGKKDTVFCVDHRMCLKMLTLGEAGLKASELYSLDNSLSYSTDFNITRKDTYAVPIIRGKKQPYYFFNADSGFYWVDAPMAVFQNMPNDAVAFVNSICLNEKANTVVSAFRFTNCLSFYQLDGKLRTTIQFGDELIIPKLLFNQKDIDVEGSQKCFIGLYGTPRYVYCLYAGSNDFSAKSKVVVFQWNGKHIQTWKTDRILRLIAVDKDDQYILAVASHKEKGQDIIRYELEW